MTEDRNDLVVLSPPEALRLDGHKALEEPHAGSFRTIVESELQRYPATLQTHLPQIALLESATYEGVAIRARYFHEHRCGVLTPQLDLRGNVHRVIAASLLARHPSEAQALKAAWTAVEGTNPSLYRGAFSEEGEQIALIAALISARQTLAGGSIDSVFATRLSAAVEFLNSVGIADAQRTDRPNTPYAFLSTTTGEFPAYTLLPGKIPLQLRPPGDDVGDGHRYVPVAPSTERSVTMGLARDIWVLPESLLSDVVASIYVVEDVSHPGCDILGFARGSEGSRAQIVIERVQRRTILFHELGHAIHFRHADAFPESAWNSLVRPGDSYFGSATEFANFGSWLPDFSPSLLERGFITSYASSTLSEDVAELTEALLSGEPRLWASLSDAPLVAGKVTLMIDFLHHVNPVFTRSYLEQLSTIRIAQEAAWGRA